MQIKQIIANTVPMWALFKDDAEEYIVQPVIFFAFMDTGGLIAMIGDEAGEYFDPRTHNNFIKFVYSLSSFKDKEVSNDSENSV